MCGVGSLEVAGLDEASTGVVETRQALHQFSSVRSWPSMMLPHHRVPQDAELGVQSSMSDLSACIPPPRRCLPRPTVADCNAH